MGLSLSNSGNVNTVQLVKDRGGKTWFF